MKIVSIAFIKSESMQYESGGRTLYQDRYNFRINSDDHAFLTCCTEYPIEEDDEDDEDEDTEPPVTLALYAYADRINDKAKIQRCVDLIPQEQYVKDLLCNHEVALYLREHGLK